MLHSELINLLKQKGQQTPVSLLSCLSSYDRETSVVGSVTESLKISFIWQTLMGTGCVPGTHRGRVLNETNVASGHGVCSGSVARHLKRKCLSIYMQTVTVICARKEKRGR